MITQLSQIERSLSKITSPSYHTVQGSMRHLSMSQSQMTRSKIYTSSHPESQFLQLDNDILEIYNEFEKNYNTIQEIDKTNTKIEAKQKFIEQPKIIQQQKKLLKTFDGLQQSDLEIEYINRIQIVRFRFYYFRIKIKGKQCNPPLQILLNFPSKITSTQYKLFVSTSIEFPNKFNADQTVQSRFVKVNSKQNSKLFFDEYVYITFYSEFDAIIGMQITFGEQYTPTNAQKQVQSMLNIDTFPERRTIHPKDKILQNIEMAKTKTYSKLDEILKAKRNTIQNILDRHTKSQETIQKSKWIQKEVRQTRLIKLLVKDQIVQFREVEKVHQKELQLQIFVKKNWILITTIFNVCRQIHRRLEKIRHKNKIAAKAKLLVWQLHTKALIEVRKYGDNPFIRSLSKSSLVLSTYTQYIQEKCITRAEGILSEFLVDIILYQTFINKHISLISKSIHIEQVLVKCIQRNYRKLRLVRKNFKDKFIKAFKEKLQVLYQGRGSDQKARINIEQYFSQIIFRHIITKLFDEYSAKIKHRWIDSRRAMNVLSVLKKSFSVSRQDIKLYSLPDEAEMQLIIQQYYKIKKQLS
ncbi:unnamed protein product (macronuclear) [Paramecium tetraurelia]|uniref:IQ calmodulin-binding motif family protein n=1 Tax=Paramecium tetraurelia TaxID=5888 RepID=A0DVS2_PARTE|nr:uncharacterized protein GSPATT00020792001 [Paramecium tetraurelia]CAK87139.1 unnamed protein product [Paramecium tetraurelia]|eukprot:XP_001454536.1 hypothetical protein (macronuclear) [Paramecium tetraurelia strain d4-2]